MWGNEPSPSQVGSHFGNGSPHGFSNFQRANCNGQNPLDWDVPYIIENFLEVRCLKWARMTHLDTEHTSYGQKKGWESNWQFDSHPLKVENSPDFLACRWRATYRWKDLDERYNFALDLISIRGVHTKIWVPKIAEVLTFGILGFPLGSLGTKCHLGANPMARYRVYYRGEGGGLPQVQAKVSPMNPNLPMARLNTKSALAMH